MKHSFETKLSAVKAIIDGHHTTYSMATEIGTNRSVVRAWLKQYEKHGEKGLIHTGATYSGEFKIFVIKYMHDMNLSQGEAAIHFGIRSRSHISKWERILYEEGSVGLMLSGVATFQPSSAEGA